MVGRTFILQEIRQARAIFYACLILSSTTGQLILSKIFRYISLSREAFFKVASPLLHLFTQMIQPIDVHSPLFMHKSFLAMAMATCV